MAIFLFLLSVIFVSAQTIVSVSPAGDRPTRLENCPECAALREVDGFALEPLIRVQFSAPVDANGLRNRVVVIWRGSRQSDGFTTYPEGYRMPINNLAWEASTNTLYAKPDEPLDHDRDYSLEVNGSVVSRFHTRNVTQTILRRRPGPTGSIRRELNSTVDMSEIKSLRYLTQTNVDPQLALTEEAFAVEPSFLTGLGLRRLVFMSFESSRGDRVAVHAWLPSGAKPVSGWPVKLVGHGLFDQRLSGPTLFASAFISNSVVMSIDAVGHGYGLGSLMRFTKNDGSIVDAPTQGRGRDLNGDGRIDAAEGCILLTPGTPDFVSTCLRETALDYQKLVREIQTGIDLDGDGQNDLDANRIQYLGQSLGAMYGTILMAIEPGVDAAVLNVGAGSSVEAARNSNFLTPLLRQYLAATYPALASVVDPNVSRYRPVQNISKSEAEYLEVLDRLSILETPGTAAAFAPFLKQATLYGNPIKRVLFQYAQGDLSIPNTANGQLIRAAFEYELVSLYRHDLARIAAPALPENPHTYMAAFGQLDQSTLLIALATLTQASLFLDSGLRQVPDVNGLVRFLFRRDLFETPALLP